MKTTRERRTTTPDAGAATHGETTMHDTGTTTRGRGMPARFAASWRRVRALLVKEMRQLLRDPRTQRIIFVAPLLQLVLFSYAATTDVHDVATFLVDHDRTPASRALVDALTASGYFRIVGRFDRPADLAAALDRGRATIGVEIPRGFARDLAAGRGARVQILVDGTNSNTETVAQGYATRIVREFGAREAMRARGGSGISPQDAAAMAFPAGSAMHTSGGGTGGLAEAPAAAGIVEHIAAGRVELRARAWFNPELTSRAYNVPAVIGAILMLTCLLLTALAVVRERELGTLDQLTVTPISPGELILGKTIPVAAIAVIDLVLIAALAVLWFEVPLRGSPLTLLVASSVFILASLGLGLLISTVSRTQQEAFMAMFLIFLPTIVLSGFMYPIHSMPAFFRTLTLLNPMRHFLEIVRAIFLEGAGLAEIAPQLTVIAAMAAAALGFATRRFPRTLR